MTSPIQTTTLPHGSIRPSASDVQSPTGVQVVEYSAVFKQNEQSLDPWVKVLHRVIKAIVTIKAKTLRCFDTDHASSYEGTGFVVDKKMGLILSNRHIVRQGPITARAIFGNYEEIFLEQAYFDPVHDFGFFKYDPTKVKFAEVEEIELYPQGAKVGLEIKVCGNDAGEKLSIASATLARLDRAAPEYGFGYNDFNINYFQAASGTSGGSSGSPVLDIQGRAIALNAGANVTAASGFFLPLDPAVCALKFLQRRESVPRGTLQTIFIHSSYDELKRLGFPESAEEACRKRNKENTGLLTVSDIIPEGPGYNAGLEVGDILVECHESGYGKVAIEGFNQLWEIIDNSVSKNITLAVYRGQERKDIVACVQDLHSITPNTFLELGNGMFNPLSYQLARRYHMPCRGVYAAEGGIFNSADTKRNFLLTQLAGKPINSLDDLKQIYLSCPDRKRVGFQFFPLDGRDQKFDTVEIDHHFYANAQFTRTDAWRREVLPLTPTFEPPAPLKRAPTIDIQQTAKAEVLRNTLVMVECRIPYGMSGNPEPSMPIGTGILVAAGSKPLIIVSRAVILTAVCDVSITIGKHEIPARILYYGLVVILTVDSGLLPDALPLPKFSTREYRVGDTVELYGLNDEHQLLQRRTEISTISLIISKPDAQYPVWRITNTEGYNLHDLPYTEGGVLVDPSDDSIFALWMQVKHSNGVYYMGLNYQLYLHPIIEALKNGTEIPSWHSGCIFGQRHVAKALSLGMPEHHATRINEIAQSIRTAPQAVYVEEKLRQSNGGLEIGDFILEIEGKAVGRMADVRRFSQVEMTKVLVLRDGDEKEITVHCKHLPFTGPPKVICWGGAILQQTPMYALEQTKPEFAQAARKEGVVDLERLVYISTCFDGSPAQGVLSSVNWIVEIDDQKVDSVEGLMDIIDKLKDRSESDDYIRIKMIGKQGAISKVGIRLSSHFWPTWVLEWNGRKWARTELE